MRSGRGDEALIADAVRHWAQRVLPDDGGAATIAVAAALNSYAEGASTREACEAAQRLIRSWADHPARRSRPGKSLAAAS